MSIDHATLRHLAKLARLRLEKCDFDSLPQELDSILAQAEQLRAVNVEGVAPLTGGLHQALPMRPDEVTDGGITEAILANAPARSGDFFVVPKVVE